MIATVVWPTTIATPDAGALTPATPAAAARPVPRLPVSRHIGGPASGIGQPADVRDSNLHQDVLPGSRRLGAALSWSALDGKRLRLLRRHRETLTFWSSVARVVSSGLDATEIPPALA